MAGAAPAAANGSMTDAVGRVSACFAEGPEHTQSTACKSAVGAHGSHGAQGAQGAHGTQGAHRDKSAPRVHSSRNALEKKRDGHGDRLAQTGGDGTTTNLAVAGAGVLVVGAGLVCFGARRRDLGRRSGD
jgi:chitin-binding protein